MKKKDQDKDLESKIFTEIREELKKKANKEKDLKKFMIDMYHGDTGLHIIETLGMYIKTLYPEFKDNAEGLVDEALGDYEQQQHELEQTYNKRHLILVKRNNCWTISLIQGPLK
jgi:hypothetical protein